MNNAIRVLSKEGEEARNAAESGDFGDWPERERASAQADAPFFKGAPWDTAAPRRRRRGPSSGPPAGVCRGHG